MLSQMDMTDIFDTDIEVVPVNSLAAIMAVIQTVELFQPQDEGYKRIQHNLHQAGFTKEGSVNIGIKRLLSLIEMARQDEMDSGEQAYDWVATTGPDSLFQRTSFSTRYSPSCPNGERGMRWKCKCATSNAFSVSIRTIAERIEITYPSSGEVPRTDGETREYIVKKRQCKADTLQTCKFCPEKKLRYSSQIAPSC